MNLQQQAIQGVVWSAIQNWGNQTITLIIFFVLARLLNPETFGLAAISAIVVAFLQVFFQRSLTAGLIQRQTLDAVYLQTAFWLNLAVAVGLMFLMLTSSLWVANRFSQPQLAPILATLSLLLPVLAFSQVQQSLLERQFAFKAIAIQQLVGTCIGGIVGIGIALKGGGIWSLVSQQLVQEGVGTVVLWRLSPWRPRVQFSAAYCRDLMQFGWPLLGFNFLQFWNSRADDLLIGYFLGLESLGYYSTAYRILGVMQQLLIQVSKQVALPTFSRLQHDPEQFRAAFYQATQLTSIIAFPIFLGVVVLAPELVMVLFGQQWLPSIAVLQVLALAGVFQSISFFKSAVFVAMGQPMWNFWLSILSAVLNLVSFTIAVQWGIVAVAAAFVIRGYLVFPIGQWAVGQLIHTSMQTYIQKFLAPLGSSAVMVIVMLGCKQLLQTFTQSSLGLICLCSLVGMVTYVITLRISAPKLFQDFYSMFNVAISALLGLG
ncbi:lipopolysaccharide biosynthesis protein [Altericista sp. CCNU0014]|uniref:lipopolysaccharide biosynthesis protein n=1 Tax=Altericista sp. CCNU0014 TaxID=3082949 RepID=UPI00384B0608